MGDTAFPLTRYLMRPCPGQKLTQEKRIFFFVITDFPEQGWWLEMLTFMRTFHRKINLHPHPKRVDTRVVACCILHNYLLCPNDNQKFLDEAGEKRQPMGSVKRMRGHRTSHEACNVRETFFFFLTLQQVAFHGRTE